ncbi:MAG: SLC13 family permease, partial [Planctomycetota bacterium]
EPGDTLLLQTRSDFVRQHRNNRDFYLVSDIGGSSARRHDRALIAGGLFLMLIAWLVASSLAWPRTVLEGFFGLDAAMLPDIKPIAAIAIVIAMIVTRCLSTAQARRAIDLQVLITIAAAIGLGSALNESGAAAFIAESLVELTSGVGLPTGLVPVALLAVVYVISMLLTEVITNVAVASLMIPLAVSVATAAGLDPKPFVIGVAVASSLSFVTPIGYQTNLMVMGPGGYQPRDYLRVGLPLAVLTAVTALTIIPMAWPP